MIAWMPVLYTAFLAYFAENQVLFGAFCAMGAGGYALRDAFDCLGALTPLCLGSVFIHLPALCGFHFAPTAGCVGSLPSSCAL